LLINGWYQWEKIGLYKGLSQSSKTRPSTATSPIPSIKRIPFTPQISLSLIQKDTMARLSTTLLLACSMFLSISHAQEDPTPAPGEAPWNYAGCANETPGRTLNGAGTTNNGTMEVAFCLKFCAEKEFGLAGLEFGSE
jgi:hypothetical protein